MNRDGVKLLLLFLLIGFGLLFLASPFGDWLQGLIHTTESEPQQRQAAHPPPSALPVLRLKREILKSVGDSDDGPKLPAPKTHDPRGTLANEEIETAIEQRQSSFQRCWTQRLKEMPGLSGKILLQFEITGRGKIQNVMVAESTIRDDIMVRCLVSVLERISFRDFAGGPISLTFPLSFE